MIASQEILSTWRKFDDFPMETLAKAWFYKRANGNRQRDVSLMKEHRSQYGMSGNCFDLAIWLLDEFTKNGIEAYPIGQDLKTKDAHVSIVALDENGQRFLCDLGDQWLNPVLLDLDSEDYTNDKLRGFFPAAQIQVKPKGNRVELYYHRSSGKVSKQTYHTEPLDIDFFMEAAEFSQNLIKPKPLLECRIPYKNEVAHWEFCNWKSFLSTSEGLFHEQQLGTIEEWAEKINQQTDYDQQFLIETLTIYKELAKIKS
ncbi:hypothetical protein [Jeotgalibacillus marinus]|uniref:Arylamine N-acetyltransferase n=1 Tax=Jeotgalibacillus marinus TaxID=86667 RepID=A0ABV3Q6L1_9BACL